MVVSVLFTVLSLHTGSATEITSSRGGEVPVGSRAQEKGQTLALWSTDLQRLHIRGRGQEDDK